MGIPLNKAKHILTAEKEGLGTTNLNEFRFNTDWHQHIMKFHIRKTLIDYVSSLLFCSDRLARAVMDSPITPLLYRIAWLLRTDEEKMQKNKLKSVST